MEALTFTSPVFTSPVFTSPVSRHTVASDSSEITTNFSAPQPHHLTIAATVTTSSSSFNRINFLQRLPDNLIIQIGHFLGGQGGVALASVNHFSIILMDKMYQQYLKGDRPGAGAALLCARMQYANPALRLDRYVPTDQIGRNFLSAALDYGVMNDLLVVPLLSGQRTIEQIKQIWRDGRTRLEAHLRHCSEDECVAVGDFEYESYQHNGVLYPEDFHQLKDYVLRNLRNPELQLCVGKGMLTRERLLTISYESMVFLVDPDMQRYISKGILTTDQVLDLNVHTWNILKQPLVRTALEYRTLEATQILGMTLENVLCSNSPTAKKYVESHQLSIDRATRLCCGDLVDLESPDARVALEENQITVEQLLNTPRPQRTKKLETILYFS